MADAQSRFENHGINQRGLGEEPAAAIDAVEDACRRLAPNPIVLGAVTA